MQTHINNFEIDQYNVHGIQEGAKYSICPKCSHKRKPNVVDGAVVPATRLGFVGECTNGAVVAIVVAGVEYWHLRSAIAEGVAFRGNAQAKGAFVTSKAIYRQVVVVARVQAVNVERQIVVAAGPGYAGYLNVCFVK